MRFGTLFLLFSLLLMVACRTSKSPSVSNKNLDESNGKPSISASKKAKAVIQEARRYIGTPYKYAGMDRNGIDCSGLVCQSFSEIGIILPHQSTQQSKLGKSISLNSLIPGDLVFLGSSKGSKKITHVGLVSVVGNGKIMFIHASTQKGVLEENLLERWYKPLFIKGVRLF